MLFLDTNLPKILGINYYKSLGEKPLGVFTNAYAEYAVEGFELDAADYLVKPFSFERFLLSAFRVKKKLKLRASEQEEVLIVKFK